MIRNLISLLRRGLVVAAVASSVIVGSAGATRAEPSPTTPTSTSTSLATVTRPSRPRSLTATPAATTVRLRWRAPAVKGGAAIDRYAVQRAVAGGSWKTIARRTTHAYTVPALTPGTTYTFRIRALNAAGWSRPSRAVHAMPRSVPAAPRSPSAAPGNGTVKLTWLAPASSGGAPINRYSVERAAAPNGPWTRIAKPTTRSYLATGLTNGTSYSFRIAAHNALGWGAPTTVVNAAPRTVPTEPLSLVASAGKEMVALNWAAPTATGGAPIDGYVVRRATAPGGPWTDVAHPTVLGYFDSGLTAGVTYWFQVAAHNAAGSSAPSIAASAVPVTVPGPPTLLTATPLNDQLTLSWHAPWSDGGLPIGVYQVDVATSANGPWTSVASTPNLQHVVQGVLPGKTYYFRILAHNAVGWGSSAYGSVTVPPKVPGVPATCAAVQLGGDGSTTARITWSRPVSDGGSPILFYRITAWKYNGPVVMQTAVWTPGTTYDADLPTGDPFARYEIYVEAFNKVGVGPVCDVPVWMYKA